MFTVIIATKEIIDLFEEFKIFLKPMFDKENIAFCEWDKDGSTLEEMLPNIYKTIAFQKEWRAVVINDDGLNQINPFDYVQYQGSNAPENATVWEKLALRRGERLNSFEKALNNPLTKLTSALCGTPVQKSIIQDEESFQAIISGEKELYQYMLQLQLNALNLPDLAGKLSNYGSSSLLKYVKSEDIDGLIAAIRKGDGEKIIDMIDVGDIIDFIKFIGNNDPIFSDPEYTECVVESTFKSNLFETIAGKFDFKDKRPSEVVCLAPRTYDIDTYNRETVWKNHDESNYSQFTEYNLYPDKLKYLVFDILPKDNKQYAFEQIKFLSLVLILAGNPMPNGVVSHKKVYSASVDFDVDEMSNACAAYLGKLRATKMRIKELQKKIEENEHTPLEGFEARDLFEAEATVPVVIDSHFERSLLMAEYKNIGLSNDCPRDEYSYWDNQYRSINKMFVRFLREPRRALKKAVTEDFRKKNTIVDERILRMNEDQLDDVLYKLQEEEQKMVETKTTQLYATEQYRKELEKADKELRRGIRQRMSKRHTLIVGAVALAAFSFGFIPLILSHINTAFSMAPSLITAAVSVGLFAFVGMCFLYRSRRKIINRFKHFNFVMSGVLLDIEIGLRNFADYLSHLCNVMREFSVLNYAKKKSSRKQVALKKHLIDVNNQIDDVNKIFAHYMHSSHPIPNDCEPYEFDFTIIKQYTYEMPYPVFARNIEYMQNGNTICVPVSFVKSVNLTREGLYE